MRPESIPRRDASRHCGVLGILSWLVLLAAAAAPRLAAGAPASRAADSLTLPVAVEPNHALLRYTGRFDWRDPAGPRMAWSGCQVGFRFRGTAASAVLKDFASGGPHRVRGNNDNYFNVIVDGGEPKVLSLEKGRTVYRLAEGLSAGEHTVTLFRRTEPLFQPVQFLGLQLEAGSALVAMPPRPGRLIEFIGDSITAGYGNEAADANEPFTPLTQNNYLAYGAIAARRLGAEYVCLAWSGQGVYRDRQDKMDKVLPVLYARSLPEDASSLHDPNAYHPDAVVINLCTNDFATSIPPKEDFLKAYRGLVDTVHRQHPRAHVFCAVGPMMYDGAPPPAGMGLTTIRAWLTELAADYAKAGRPEVHYFEFDRPPPEFGRGSNYHPSLKTHQAMADKLAAAIAKELGWQTAASPAAASAPAPAR